jgi:hypothetical protein
MAPGVTLEDRLNELRRIGLVRGVDLLPKGHTRIETAFHYPDGSSIDLFIPRQGSLLQGLEPIELTDFGYTLSWLAQLGIDPLKSPRRRKLMDDVLRIYEAKEQGAAIKCRVPLHELGAGMVRLGQACVRISDLAFTARFMPHARFEEEVEDVLDSAGFSYEPEAQLIGRGGNIVKVDFRIRGQRSETALMLLPAETKNQMAANNRAHRVFVAFFDLQDWPGQRIAALDDRATIYRDTDLSRIESLAPVVPFSERELLFELLKAA